MGNKTEEAKKKTGKIGDKIQKGIWVGRKEVYETRNKLGKLEKVLNKLINNFYFHSRNKNISKVSFLSYSIYLYM